MAFATPIIKFCSFFFATIIKIRNFCQSRCKAIVLAPFIRKNVFIATARAGFSTVREKEVDCLFLLLYISGKGG